VAGNTSHAWDSNRRVPDREWGAFREAFIADGSGPERIVLHAEPPLVPVMPSRDRLNTGLLLIWIGSFTYSIDVISELKLYDLAFFVCLVYFRREFATALTSGDPILRSLRFLIAVFIWGTLVSMLAIEDHVGERWMEILALRLTRLVNYVSVFAVIRCMYLTRGALLTLYVGIVVFALIQAVLIVLQFLGIVPILWPAYEMYYSHVLTGTLSLNHANSVLFFSVGIAASMGLLLWRYSMHWPILILGIVGMVGAMLIGEARTSYMAFAVLIVSFLRNPRTLVVVGLACLIAPLLAQVTGFDVSETMRKVWNEKVVRRVEEGDLRLVNEVSDLDKNRPEIWRRGVAGLWENPHVLLVGHGFQNYKTLRKRNAAAAHNLFLHVIVELGIVGWIAYGLFFYYLHRELRSMGRGAPGRRRLLSTPGRTLITLILVLGLVQQTFYPYRALSGFMGYCLAFFAILSHAGWVDPIPRRSSTESVSSLSSTRGIILPTRGRQL
jgi:O-antigen ligase